MKTHAQVTDLILADLEPYKRCCVEILRARVQRRLHLIRLNGGVRKYDERDVRVFRVYPGGYVRVQLPKGIYA